MLTELPQEVSEVTDQIERAASGIVIANDAGYEDAARLLIDVDKAAKQINEKRLSLTRPLDTAKKQITDLFRGPLERLEQASGRIRSGMAAYNRAKEEAARIEREKQAAEARRIAAEKEAERIAALEAALASGDTAQAEAIVEAPPPVVELPPAAPVPAAPKVAGVTTRTVWKFRIVNAAQIPREYLIPNEAVLQSIANAQKERAIVAGVEFYSEQLVVRTGR